MGDGVEPNEAGGRDLTKGRSRPRTDSIYFLNEARGFFFFFLNFFHGGFLFDFFDRIPENRSEE